MATWQRAESIPWKAFRLIKRLKEDEWGWMDKNGLEEIKYSIAPHYSPHRAILYSFLYAWNTCNGMTPLFGCKMRNWREKWNKWLYRLEREQIGRDGKDKEPEVSSRLSLRHLAVLTMSNFPLDPRLPMQSPSCCTSCWTGWYKYFPALIQLLWSHVIFLFPISQR